MPLLVDVPSGRESERRYVLDVVLGRWLGLDWEMAATGRTDVRLHFPGLPGEVRIPEHLFAVGPEQWLAPASLPTARTGVVDDPGSSALRRGETVPVLFGALDRSPLLARADGAATLGPDVFGTVFFLLTRYEELVVPERDGYDRFPAAASVLAGSGLLGVPVADLCVELLWSAIEHVWPRVTRRRGTYRVALTHDVDDPVSTFGRGVGGLVLQCAADLGVRRDPGLLFRRLRALGGRGPDPHDTFDLLMDVSEAHGHTSDFYFRSHRQADPAAGATYALGHPWIRDLLRRIHARGHGIGYHAGFGTHLDAAHTAAEFDHLRAVAGEVGVDQERWGGRQHFLQWRAPVTWRNWAAAGLTHDCTVGYADAIGFRTGTSREYPVYDLLERRPLALTETPFQVMDVTLVDPLGLGPGPALQAVTDLAAECRRFDGVLGLLWHNETLRGTRTRRWYREMVAAVT